MQNEVQTTSLVEVQQMVQSITKQQGINTLAFVGCGASMSELISGTWLFTTVLPKLAPLSWA